MTRQQKEDRALAKALCKLQKRGCDIRLTYTSKDHTCIAVEADGAHYGVWEVAECRWKSRGECVEVFNLLLSRLSRQGSVNVRYMNNRQTYALIEVNGVYAGTWDIARAAWVD